jgi:hypothetical protein
MTVEAVLSAPMFLTNLSEAELSHVRERWRRTRYPEECKRVDLLEKDLEHLSRGGNIVMTYPRKCAVQAIVDAAKASNDAANKAIAAAGATDGSMDGAQTLGLIHVREPLPDFARHEILLHAGI